MSNDESPFSPLTPQSPWVGLPVRSENSAEIARHHADIAAQAAAAANRAAANAAHAARVAARAAKKAANIAAILNLSAKRAPQGGRRTRRR
jgi:hypothetical protein